jgi:hypothetical protein
VPQPDADDLPVAAGARDPRADTAAPHQRRRHGAERNERLDQHHEDHRGQDRACCREEYEEQPGHGVAAGGFAVREVPEHGGLDRPVDQHREDARDEQPYQTEPDAEQSLSCQSEEQRGHERECQDDGHCQQIHPHLPVRRIRHFQCWPRSASF